MNEERQSRILDACTTLFLKYGYDKTTVSDIAKEAGVSKGAIYLHFASKEEMAAALIWREAEYSQVRVAELMANDPRGGSFVSLYVHSLRVAAERPLLAAIYGNRKHVLGDALRTLSAKMVNQATRERSVQFVQEYQALGLIRQELNPRAVAFLLAFMRYGLLTIDDVYSHEEFPSMPEVFELLADVLGRGLGTDGGDYAAGREKFSSYMADAVEKGKAAMKESDKKEEK